MTGKDLMNKIKEMNLEDKEIYISMVIQKMEQH
jgi:hypothetical protein